MRYLRGYIALGVVVFVVVLVTHWISTRSASDLASKMKQSIHPGRKSWGDTLMENIVMPSMAAVFVFVAWPVLIYMKAKELLFPAKAESLIEPKKFAVAETDLVLKQTVEEIEQLERVCDPLHAVPDLPFGHLNAAWTRFIADCGPEDTVWSFSARWTSEWGQKEICEGYVIVREEAIGPHFLTTWQMACLRSAETK